MSNKSKKPTVFTEFTKCDFCDFSTGDPKVMERHITVANKIFVGMSNKKNRRQKDSETHCQKCPMKFCTIGSLMFHIADIHSKTLKL